MSKDRALALLHRCIDYLQAKFPPNRIVLLLTPLLAPVAAAIGAWVGTHFPGVDLSEGTIIAFAAAAGLALLRSGYKWVDRWQEEERSSERIWEAEKKTELAPPTLASTKLKAGRIGELHDPQFRNRLINDVAGAVALRITGDASKLSSTPGGGAQ